jgi:hypothetical protein
VLNADGEKFTEYSDLARRAGRGKVIQNLDFSMVRNFRYKEGFNLQFRAETFNISNTPAFSRPQTALNSPLAIPASES